MRNRATRKKNRRQMVITPERFGQNPHVRLAFDHHHRAQSCQETRAVSSRQEISQEANLLPYSKAIQIGTNTCQTNTKPWNKESRISN